MAEKAPLAILMPKVTDYERTRVRYGGLVKELGARGVDSFIVQSHDSYNDKDHIFSDPRDLNQNHRTDIAGGASVVRDLTMALGARPLYSDADGPKVVHDPQLNQFIARKDYLVKVAPEIHPATYVVESPDISEAVASIAGLKAVVKPVTGHLSRGVIAGKKSELASQSYTPGLYLVQEFIDTSRGIPELGINGVHNLRTFSIDSEPFGAIARIGGKSKEMLINDIYGRVMEFDTLSPGIQRIVGTVHDILMHQPGDGHNVIAIDTMRGLNADGEMVDILCEVNRRPQRISRYDLRSSHNTDPKGIEWIARQWDVREAEMLASLR